MENKNPFTDGAEEWLLHFFEQNPTEEDIHAVLEKEPSWPIRYHLSPLRKNLLSWYPFGEGKKLLEVGAGCGALTGVLLGEKNRVTAIELSQNRAAVIRARHSAHKEQLTVVQESFETYSTEERFDYLTSIGVFEYTNTFFSGEQKSERFLKKAHELLLPGGVFIIAIENKYGIKYWSGAKEDHTQNYFESIENYPAEQGILTYGRKELEDLLKGVGFSTTAFYYPFPDYKLPTELFSDQYLPSSTHPIRNGVFPTMDYASERGYLFEEERAMEGIMKNNMVPFFANSFLVFATK